MKGTIVIMNENHKLLPEQEQILNSRYGEDWEILKVPASGWTLEQMEKIRGELWNVPEDIVFISPVPYLLKELAYVCGERDGANVGRAPRRILVFHNDRREKKELPDGRVISVVAREGWQLV